MRPVAMLAAGLMAAALFAGCGLSVRNPVPPPKEGAFFGGYVQPELYTETGRIDAFTAYERQMGRELDIFHNYHTWDDPFPSEADRYFADRGTAVLISWAGTNTSDVLSGRYDSLIRQRAADVAALGSPILLRWRWEMNRPNLRDEIGSGPQYVEAWRHLHWIFAEADVTNVSWVWCPLISTRADPNYDAYYPGDAYVDWTCIDGYPQQPRQSFAQIFQPFLHWAESNDKPVMIGEFGRRQGSRGERAAWLTDAQRFVEKTPRIRAVCYFESEKEPGRYGLRSEPDAMAAMRSWANADYFDVA